jgi:hypothetical protein
MSGEKENSLSTALDWLQDILLLFVQFVLFVVPY